MSIRKYPKCKYIFTNIIYKYMYNYFNNLNLNYKLNILVIFNTFMYFRIKYDNLNRNTQIKPYLLSIFGYFFVYLSSLDTKYPNRIE